MRRKGRVRVNYGKFWRDYAMEDSIDLVYKVAVYSKTRSGGERRNMVNIDVDTALVYTCMIISTAWAS